MKQTLLFAVLAFAACTSTTPPIADAPSTAPPCPANTPASLAPDAGAELAFALDAQGVQRYTCTASGWSAAIPAATLFTVGKAPREWVTHFGGPTWLSVLDSSSIVATKHASEIVDAGAIPWLLLDVSGHAGSASGILAPITQIQRLSTVGGVTPSSGCDAAHVGLEVDVLYQARYWFYRKTSVAGAHQRCGA